MDMPLLGWKLSSPAPLLHYSVALISEAIRFCHCELYISVPRVFRFCYFYPIPSAQDESDIFSRHEKQLIYKGLHNNRD